MVWLNSWYDLGSEGVGRVCVFVFGIIIIQDWCLG